MIHLDTHILVWLYSRRRRRIPAQVHRRLERESVAISPVVEMELAFLFQVGKVSGPPAEVLDDLGASLGLTTSDAPFAAVARAAVALTWTRDPFDRLIVAQSVVDRADLVTADESILANHPGAIWGEDRRAGEGGR